MKYALITGASRGIGRAIAVQLAKDGYVVVVNYLNNAVAAKETLRMIEENGGKGELLPFDISKPNDIKNAMDAWRLKHEGEHFDVLINNAGITRDGLMAEMLDDDWHKVVDTSLNGFFYITRHWVEDMISAHYGRIINITSVSAVVGTVGQVNYSAAKAALIGATKSLARELAPKKITVNAVAPGFIETEMTKDVPAVAIRQAVPMRRMGTAQEVADLVSFLVSDKAAYITGQVIGINGGMI